MSSTSLTVFCKCSPRLSYSDRNKPTLQPILGHARSVELSSMGFISDDARNCSEITFHLCAVDDFPSTMSAACRGIIVSQPFRHRCRRHHNLKRKHLLFIPRKRFDTNRALFNPSFRHFYIAFRCRYHVVRIPFEQDLFQDISCLWRSLRSFALRCVLFMTPYLKLVNCNPSIKICEFFKFKFQ